MSNIPRKYPIGIQTFERMIQEGYIYIDKTDMVWDIAHLAPFVFLSRPRRFGKSLLSSTLHSFFAGEKHLFKGLKIMEMEKDWNKYPVIHLDLSTAKNQSSPADISKKLRNIVEPYTIEYDIDINMDYTPGDYFNNIIRRAYQQTGKQVAIIIDEYDAPLLDMLHDPERLTETRRIMQDFYQHLKSNEQYIRFCFITGITKFSQLSIFSTLNNLKNISMLPAFAAICGITEKELTTTLSEDIQKLATEWNCSFDEAHKQLKQQYDGYHFAHSGDEVYNPFSLFNAFGDMELNNYWFSTGTPTFLIRQMQHFHTDITALNDYEVPADAFDLPTETLTNALPLLYQSGYVTIKGYDRLTKLYRLAIPNNEVLTGLTKGLIPSYIGIEAPYVQTGFAVKFWRALLTKDIDLALKEMKAFMAGIPYVEGFKKKLAEATTAEGFYEYTLYLIFSMLNVYVQTQVKCHGGRIDMVVMMPDTTYVFEIKTSLSVQKAMRQIDDRGYVNPYLTKGRQVVKVAVKFDCKTMNVQDWSIVPLT